jgi:predicted dehydrogenase
MVGGGPGSFIGAVHRKAIALDGLAVLAAGCFSSDPGRSRETGASLGLEPGRVYASWDRMAERESGRPDGIDFIVVVTPNSLHFPVCSAFLEAGIHLVCDKPLAVSSAECAALENLAAERGLLGCVTYTYTGYAAVKQARAMVAQGRLGKIRFVNAEYPQEFFARPAEREGNRQAEWRFDPARSGPVGTLGDVGTHVENMVSYVTGLRLARVCARLETFVPGRVLDDNATVMTEYEGGATGLYWACQAAPGEGNGLAFRVYGDEGSISWRQEEPERLRVRRLGEPEQVWRRGREAFDPAAAAFSRVPAGHPEGYFEAFANVYTAFTGALSATLAGEAVGGADYPGLAAGTAGLRFVEACLASSRGDAAWTAL